MNNNEQLINELNNINNINIVNTYKLVNVNKHLETKQHPVLSLDNPFGDIGTTSHRYAYKSDEGINVLNLFVGYRVHEENLLNDTRLVADPVYDISQTPLNQTDFNDNLNDIKVTVD